MATSAASTAAQSSYLLLADARMGWVSQMRSRCATSSPPGLLADPRSIGSIDKGAEREDHNLHPQRHHRARPTHGSDRGCARSDPGSLAVTAAPGLMCPGKH